MRVGVGVTGSACLSVLVASTTLLQHAPLCLVSRDRTHDCSIRMHIFIGRVCNFIKKKLDLNVKEGVRCGPWHECGGNEQ